MPSEVVIRQQAPPSLTQQAAWLLTAKVLAFFLSLAAPLLVVRILPQNEFGIYKQVFLVITTGIQLLTLGFHMNLFYFLPRLPDRKPQLVANVLLTYCALGLVGMLAVLICPSFLGRLGSGDLLQFTGLIAVALWLTVTSFFLEVVATANQDVVHSATFITMAQFTKGGFAVLAALFAGTVEALLYASIVQAALQLFVLLWYLRTHFPGFLGKPDWNLLRDQASYSLPLSAGALAVFVQTSFHQIAVAQSYSPAEYALYAVGCTSLPLIGLVRESVHSVLIPRVSFLEQQGDHCQIRRLIAATARKLALVHIPTFVFVNLAATELLTVLYTSDDASSASILRINILTLLFIVPTDPINRAFAPQRMFLLKARLIFTALLVPAVYGALESFGMAGAISAVVLLMSVDYLVVGWKALRTVQFGWRDARLFRDLAYITCAAAIAGLVAETTRRTLAGAPVFSVVLSAGMGFSIIYIAALFLLKVPTSEEKLLLRTLVGRIGVPA